MSEQNGVTDTIESVQGITAGAALGATIAMLAVIGGLVGSAAPVVGTSLGAIVGGAVVSIMRKRTRSRADREAQLVARE